MFECDMESYKKISKIRKVSIIFQNFEKKFNNVKEKLKILHGFWKIISFEIFSK